LHLSLIKYRKLGAIKSITNAIIFPWFYYVMFDLFNYTIWNLVYLPTGGEMLGINWFDVTLVLYSLFIILSFYFVYIRKNKNLLNFKAFLVVLPYTAIILISMANFGTWNMRMLEGDTRIWFYITSFIPGWALLGIGYAKLLRKQEVRK